MTLREAADLLRRDYGVTDALNLDGGGSTTLCLADPVPRVVNGLAGTRSIALEDQCEFGAGGDAVAGGLLVLRPYVVRF